MCSTIDQVQRMIQRQINSTQNFIDELELRKANDEKFADEDEWEMTDSHILNNKEHINKLQSNLKEYLKGLNE